MSWLEQFRNRKRVPAGLYSEVFDAGGETTIVFIPGLGGTTGYWLTYPGTLQARVSVILVDLLGFGQSPKPWTQYTVARQVLELHAVLEPYRRIILVGHSLGALIAVAYAARHPEQVRKIVMLGMPCFGTQQAAYRYFREGPVKGGYVFTNVVLAMIACILTRRVFGRLLPYIIRYVPRQVAEDLVKHTWRSSTSSMWEVIYRYDVIKDLENLAENVDVLFIHGDRDIMAPISAIERLVAQHPRWRLHVLQDVDHHPFLREPEACLRLIRDNCESHEEV